MNETSGAVPPFTICSWTEQFTRLLWDQQVMSCCVHNTQEQQQLFRQGVKMVDLVQKHPVSWHGGAVEWLHTSAVKLKNWRWNWVIDINPAVLIFPSWWAWVTLQRWTPEHSAVFISSEHLQRKLVQLLCLLVEDYLWEEHFSVTEEPTTERHRSSHQCLPNVIPVTHIFRII